MRFAIASAAFTAVLRRGKNHAKAAVAAFSVGMRFAWPPIEHRHRESARLTTWSAA